MMKIVFVTCYFVILCKIIMELLLYIFILKAIIVL